MRVRELMTHPVHTCRLQDRANTAAQIMWEHDCGIVPVVDADGRVVGVVTDRDLCMAAHFQNQPLSDIPLAGVMAQEVCTCVADDDVVQAERVMAEKQIHRLPVVTDDGSAHRHPVARRCRAPARNTPGRQREEAVTRWQIR